MCVVIELGLEYYKEITAPVSSRFINTRTITWKSLAALVADAILFGSDHQAVVIDCGWNPFGGNDGSGSLRIVLLV
jgi:hypothetical protein